MISKYSFRQGSNCISSRQAAFKSKVRMMCKELTCSLKCIRYHSLTEDLQNLQEHFTIQVVSPHQEQEEKLVFFSFPKLHRSPEF
ncbi:hypothetical protein L345_06301, partial [Ophiophagus hannah]